MKEYVTSDWHFGHTNMCGSEGFLPSRQHFKDTDEMDNYLIKTINSVVTNDDTLYHLGDISLHRKPQDIFNILEQLRGQLVLTKGNHDNSRLFKYIARNNYTMGDGRPKFVLHEVGHIIKRNKHVYHLTHYPLGLGEYRRNMRSICGHIHENQAREANAINVGIDSPELPKGHKFGEPLLLDTAMELVDNKWEQWHSEVERLIKS